MFSDSFKETGTKSVRRRLAIIFSLLAIFLAACGGGAKPGGPPPLVRAGSPDFEKYQQLIKIDNLEAEEAARPIGDIVMTLHATVRNFTGRTLNGLEIHAAVVDLEGQPVKERIVVLVPTRQPELENNKTMTAQVLLEGISKNATRANIKMEVTGFSFK